MANISQINPLFKSQAMGVNTAKLNNQTDGIPVFSDVFKSAIDNVKQTDADRAKAEYLLATGQLDNPAVASIANSKAQISIELMLQLRNKALESYSEITRINM